MNEKLNFIHGRRSIRQYTPETVDEQTIRSLLEAGMSAPSARACDPWRILVVTDRAKLDKLAEILPYGKMLRMAPLAFVVCGDLNQANSQSLSYLLQDCSAAIENILLAAHALGLGAVWLGIHPREDRVTGVKQLFGMPEEIIPVGAISLGHPAETKEARTRFKPEYAHYDQW